MAELVPEEKVHFMWEQNITLDKSRATCHPGQAGPLSTNDARWKDTFIYWSHAFWMLTWNFHTVRIQQALVVVICFVDNFLSKKRIWSSTWNLPEGVDGHGQVGHGGRDVGEDDGLATSVRFDLESVLHEHRQSTLTVRNVVKLVWKNYNSNELMDATKLDQNINGSGCSTAIEHTPAEQNSLGHRFNSCGVLGFFLFSFYPSWCVLYQVLQGGATLLSFPSQKMEA